MSDSDTDDDDHRRYYPHHDRDKPLLVINTVAAVIAVSALIVGITVGGQLGYHFGAYQLTWFDYLQHWVASGVIQGIQSDPSSNEIGLATPPPMIPTASLGAQVVQWGTVAASVSIARAVRKRLMV